MYNRIVRQLILSFERIKWWWW